PIPNSIVSKQWKDYQNKSISQAPYITELSSSFSKKLLKLVSKRTKEIAKNPLIYKGTNFNDIRVTSMGNFSIYYKVSDQEIIITAFWDNRQDPKKLLAILEGKQ